MSKKNLYKKFFSIVFGVVSLFILIAFVAVCSYSYFIYKDLDNTDEKKFSPKSFVDQIFLPPKKTKILVMGLDTNEALADSIFCLCFERDTQKITGISIPRDTYVKLSQETLKEMHELKKFPPSVMKINATHSYGGKEYGIKLLHKQAEELLNIKFDYYFAINISALRKIVDSVGGIYMTIQKGGLNYDDPSQNLHIHIPEGRQLLDGKMAEGVVRFRKGYARADLKRIEVQQEFMKEFFAQVLNKKTIMSNLGDLIKTYLQDIKTNFGLDDLAKYLKYVNKLSSDKISFCTLPGEPQSINGVSYFINNKKETANLIEEVFYFKNKAQDYKIKILNGSDVNGLAKLKQEELEKNNYKVLDIANYTGTKIYNTRIMVKQKDMGEDLKKYFKSAVIEIDAEIPDEYNVIIILGLSEKTQA